LSLRRELAKHAIAVIIVFGALELLLRLAYAVRTALTDTVPMPYHVAGDYGPTPPWIELRRLFVDDDVLGWRGRPNVRHRYMDVFSPVDSEDDRRVLVRRFLPWVPRSLENNPVWEVVLNSEGFRDAEFPSTKDPSTLRILCLGDSWTFGANVGQDDSYPARLEKLLHERYPGRPFEVLNLGVLGYASYNGLKMMQTRARELEPDLVVLAFAMNEGKVIGYRAPADAGTTSGVRRAAGKTAAWIGEHSEIHRLLRYVALLITWEPWPLGDYLANMVSVRQWYDRDWSLDDLDAEMKQSLREYETYHRQMLELAREMDSAVVLLYNHFWLQSPYRRTLQRLSAEEGVPLVDSSVLIERRRQRIHAALEASLDLAPAGDSPSSPTATEVVLRVHSGGYDVPGSMYVAGSHPALGDFQPNTVAMYDDGTHGDQRAGDSVYSYAAPVEPGSTLYYTYTNSGRRGVWEKLDVPALRSFTVPAEARGQRVYGPIDTFGKMYLYADPWHTDVEGNEMIARAVLEAIERNGMIGGHLTAPSRTSLRD
jgi:lysophospholipase L1-like esterase